MEKIIEGTSNKIVSWLQILGNLGLLIGLAFVAYQIKQTNDITFIQMAAVSHESLINHSLTISGENPDQAMYRVLLEPETATEQDYFIAEQVYTSLFQQLFRLQTIDRAGFGGDNDLETSILIRSYWFASPHGLAYLDSILEAMNQNSDSRGTRQIFTKLRHYAAQQEYQDVFQDRLSLIPQAAEPQ